MKTSLGILVTHPIQYFSPWFRELARQAELDFKVFYCFQPGAHQQGEGFGVAFEWDVPLLDGYPYEFLPNTALKPGVSFAGCDTPSIVSIINSRQYNAWLIHGWNVKSYWQAIRACWARRIPMLVRGDSHLLDPRPLHVRMMKRIIHGRWIPRFSGYLTVGKLNEDYYRFYGGDPKKFTPVRHFVDNEWFAARADLARKRIGEIRNRWRISSQAFTFLYCGKFIEKKRPMDVLRAIERMKPDPAKCHLLLVGDGPLRAECEAYAAGRGIPATFAGFLNQGQISEAYAAADALVMASSHDETWGLVVNEAMACGRPAILSDHVGCAPDLIVEGETGFTFPAKDVAALASAMSRYPMSPAMALAHGRAARDLIQKKYTIYSAAHNTFEAVRSVLNTPLKRDK